MNTPTIVQVLTDALHLAGMKATQAEHWGPLLAGVLVTPSFQKDSKVVIAAGRWCSLCHSPANDRFHEAHHLDFQIGDDG
jgi:hypothetical protein